MLYTDFEARSATDQGVSTIIDLLCNNALHHRESLAYTFLVDGEAEKVDLTYGELDLRSRAIGAALQVAGATGERVLLLYPPGWEFITAFLGCLYAGAVAVPAYPPRLNRSQLRLRKIVEDTRAAVALTTQSVLSKVDRVFSEEPYLRDLRWLATDDIDNDLGNHWRRPGIDGETLAMIQYTSGSTSTPKGVMVSHRNLLINERMILQAFRQTEDSIIVGWLPLHHDMGLIGNVLQPLFLGARCVLMSPVTFLQQPFRWLRAISDYRATTSGGPNFAYDLCVRKIGPDERTQLDLSSWTVAFNGSEPVSRETMERFAATFADCGFRREAFYPCYGLAEATLLVSAGPYAAQPDIEEDAATPSALILPDTHGGQRARVSCGRIMPGQRVVIVDPEVMTQCPAERVGEIWISGPNVARGYWNQDRETERTFGAFLEDIGEGPFLRTGDLGYIKDGELFMAGRIKDLIIIRGRNHYPQDLELTVQQSDPALESGACAAFSIQEADEERLVIVKELGRGGPDPSSLIETIREAVAREHEVQTYAVVLIDKGRMPKTTSGKIQRYQCRSDYQAGKLAAIAEWNAKTAPKAEHLTLNATSGSPTIEALDTVTIERSLSSFLAEKLGCPADQIEVDKSLLRLGVDSLAAIEISHFLESKYGITIPSVSLLEDATVAQLSERALDHLRAASINKRPSLSSALKEVSEHPLSYGQRSLWFLRQLAPHSGAYNVSSALWIRSALDIAAFKRSLQRIVDRHDSLRTTFMATEGEPLQRIHKQSEVSLTVTDASSWSDRFLDDCLVEEAGRPFDLELGPLLRVFLFSRSQEDHLLLVVAHHIVVDLWSMGVLIHELGLCYRAEANGAAAALDHLPINYSDYVYWQRELLAGPEGERLWNHWRNQLAGDLGTSDLPTDRARPPLQTFRGASQSVCLGRELTASLKSLGRNHGATLYTTLLAAFQALLHRYTGQEDILVGSPVAGRSAAGLAGLIGYFVNPVVMRADVFGNPTFNQFLERVRVVTLAAIEHQDYPFALLVERIQPAPDPSRSPLFQVMFALQHAPSFGNEGSASQALIDGARLDFGGLSAESLVLRQRTSQFDLSLSLVEVEDGLKGFIEYNTDLFDEWRIQRMAWHFRTLTEAAVDDPKRRIGELELLSESEQKQIIEEWNQTGSAAGTTRSAHEMIADMVAHSPEAVAVVCGEEQMTYRKLNELALRLARHLRGLGVGPEVMVGLCLERSVEMVVGILGILNAGAAYAPLDPAYPVERLDYLLNDSQVRVLLTRRQLLSRLPSHTLSLVLMDSELNVEPEEVMELGPIDGENAAYVMYTSGSSGKPKGVVVPHRALSNQLEWAQSAYQLSAADCVIHKTSFSFDPSILEILLPLTVGARIVIARPDGERDLDYLAKVLAEQRVTYLDLVPSLLQALLQSPDIASCDSLRLVVSGSETLPPHLVEMFPKKLNATLCNAYGPTETTVQSTFGVCQPNAPGSVSIGRPIANTQTYVLDAGLGIVPVGAQGELYIGGAGVSRGYWRRPELTAERFIPNRFDCEPGARLYRTGDLARYQPDGKIEFIGRADDQVKVRGYRIEPGEIQGVLNQHRSVKQSAVIVREDERGHRRLLGYVVGAEGVTAAELKRHLKERLPEYMVPETIIVLEEMPLTANGKIDRKMLPLAAADEGIGGSAAALTPVAEILTGIYEEVLGLDRVWIRDNFFEIGGHSLLATQVISRIRQSFGIEIAVRSIFEEPTVEGLARRIEEAIGIGEKEKAPPLAPAPRSGGLPLSFAQQRLWFIDQLEPGRSVYNVAGAVSLEGRLELEILERVINEVIRRHEVLRTRIEVEGGVPAQVVEEREERRLEVEDLTVLGEEEREAEAERRAREEAERGFDLSQGRLLRVKVLKMGEERHVALLTMHHIVSDGWSLGVLVKEIGALYRAFRAGESSPLPELEIQYADYAQWQRERLTGGILEGEIKYWKEQLRDAAVLELPTDRARPATPSYRGGVEKISIGKELSNGVKRLSRREGATAFIVLMAAFKVVLMRYSEEEDLVVGTVIANRARREVEDLIGFFANTLVMRTDLGGNPSFRELIERERGVALEAYGRQEAPFEKLVEEINPERGLSRSPLFQVMMTLENTRRAELEISGLKVNEIRPGTGTAKFDLNMELVEESDGFTGCIEYSQDLFDAETIRKMARHFENVVKEAVRDADQRISEIELMDAKEKEQILVEFNRTQRAYAKGRCIHELIEAQAERSGDRTAIVCEDERISYKELNRRANRLASYLVKQGVNVEDRVGICVERRIEMVVGLLGIMKAGAAYLPLDPNYPRERLEYMLQDAGAKVLLTRQRMKEVSAASGRATICLDSDWPLIDRESHRNPERRTAPENLAYVIYTSGSTGRPKGVAITHRSAVTLLNWAGEVFGEDELNGVLASTSICFDLSVFELMVPLGRGGKVVLAENVLSLPELSAGGEVLLINTVPSAIKELVGMAAIPESVETVNLAGEALRNDLAQQIYERGRIKRVLNLYGPTEDTTYSTWTAVNRGSLEEPTLGRPIANTKAYILDQAMRPGPLGIYGEIYLSGEGLARCYLNNSDITAERFLPNPFGNDAGERLYRTGDIGRYRRDGDIEYQGRADHQVKLNGYRIEPGETERALGQAERVRDAVVIVREDAPGDRRLTAYVVVEGEREGEANRLRRHLKGMLPDYMIPSAIVVLEKIPLTPNGKLNRQALPRPSHPQREIDDGPAAALTPVAEILTGIYEEVLGLDRVCIRDNFFEIGGHSLLATQVISRLRQSFGIEIAVRSIFEEPTVEGLARRIEEAIGIGEKEQAPPLVRAPRSGGLPLSFAQQRLWFIDQLEPGKSVYNVAGAVSLEGRLDLEILERVINEVIRRHEVLRTRIEVERGAPAQVVEEWEERRLEVEDLTVMGVEEREAEAERRAREEAERGFDLSLGRLLRVKVLKMGEERHVALLTMHHIVSDGWSLGVLVKEIGALYRAFRAGESSPLPELEIQYADYAQWQRRRFTDEVVEQHLAYWKMRLAGSPPALELPTDYPRPPVPNFHGAVKSCSLPAGLSQLLRSLSRQEGATLFMTLLAALKTLLYKYTAQEEIIIGAAVANRNRAEIEPLIGFFVNMLPIRTDLSGNPKFRELLRRVKEETLEGYNHQEIPFEMLVRATHPDRAGRDMPLFNIAFGVQNAPGEDLRLEGIEIRPMVVEQQAARFDLTLWITEGPEGMQADWTYSRELFKEETIVRMHKHFETLLFSIVDRPDARLTTLRISAGPKPKQAT